MEVSVNGEVVSVPEGTTVAKVVQRFVGGSSGAAVALSEEVVPASRWATTTLVAGDRLEVLQAVAGG